MSRYLFFFQTFILFFFLISCKEKVTPKKISNIELDMQGHRGARGLFPENTLPEFKAAMDLRVTTLELDTVLTKDKQLIIHHDDNLNPSLCIWLNGANVESLPVKNYTVEELKGLDCGSLKNEQFPEQIQIPGTKLSTLTEFFKFVKDYEREKKLEKPFLYNIETKLNSENYTQEEVLEYARVMVKTIEEANVVKQTTVQSFVLEVLPEVKKLNPQITTSALFVPSAFDYILLSAGFSFPRKAIIEKALEVNAEIISPYHAYVNSDFIQACRDKKIRVIPWTVNENKLIEEMISYGVDGIISDYPNRLKSFQ